MHTLVFGQRACRQTARIFQDLFHEKPTARRSVLDFAAEGQRVSVGEVGVCAPRSLAAHDRCKHDRVGWLGHGASRAARNVNFYRVYKKGNC